MKTLEELKAEMEAAYNLYDAANVVVDAAASIAFKTQSAYNKKLKEIKDEDI